MEILIASVIIILLSLKIISFFRERLISHETLQGEIVNLRKIKKYSNVNERFVLSGNCPISWLSENSWNQRIFYQIYDVNACLCAGGGSLDITKDELALKYGHNVKFSISFFFGEQFKFWVKESKGRICIKIYGHNKENQFLFLPLIVKGYEKEIDQLTISKHLELVAVIKKTERESKEYLIAREEISKKYQFKELDNYEISKNSRTINDSDLLYKVIEQLEAPEYEEILKLHSKYKETLERTGPLCGGCVGHLDGFKFIVYSNDHDPPHFHIINKQTGIDARFSYPNIELINYKKGDKRIHSKQIKNIKKFFRSPKNFERLKKEFEKKKQK